MMMPPPTPAKRHEAIQLAVAEAAQWGLTSVQDNSPWEDFLVYEDLQSEGKLTVRISEWLAFTDSVQVLQEHRAHHPHTDPMLHTGMLKGFMDGSLGSRTAALLAPYSDDPTNSGLPQFEQSQLNQMTRERVAAGFQIGFHAIGDRGVDMALQAFSAAATDIREKQLRAAASPSQADDFRFRIEHAQVVAPDQFEQFELRRNCIHAAQSSPDGHELGGIAHWTGARQDVVCVEAVPAEWCAIGFGTDYPVEPLTPFRGLYAAVTRQNEAGTKSYFPDDKLTIDEAIAAYTSESAYAEFSEREKGTLQPGMLADFVILDRDITKIPSREILGTKVLRTVVGGKTVYEGR